MPGKKIRSMAGAMVFAAALTWVGPVVAEDQGDEAALGAWTSSDGDGALLSGRF